MAIKCPKCQTDNPDTQKFCGECATPLLTPRDIPTTETLETPKEELIFAVLTSFLEDKFYESSNERLKRIQELVVSINDPIFIAKLANSICLFDMDSLSHD